MVKVKQQQNQLEAKDAEKAKAKQAAYDAGGMTKTAQSLTAQLKDIAQAFCLEVWGHALTIARVSTKSKLRAPDRVYYSPTLRLAPSLSQPSADPGFASASDSVQPATTPATTPATEKGQEQPPLVAVVDVEAEEAAEVGQLKRKKKEKEKIKKREKEKETST